MFGLAWLPAVCENWCFIGIYTVNKILYGCLKIKKLSSHVEKLSFMSQCNHHSESETFCIFILCLMIKYSDKVK